jgi:hypothetical protein
MEWKPYTRDRLIAKHDAGFYLIKPADCKDGQPLFCPTCEHLMLTSFDEEVYQKFGCCDRCANDWAYPNKEKWMSGWRPTSEEVLNKYKLDHT